MKHLICITIFFHTFMSVFTQNNGVSGNAVRESVECQIKAYPESTLKDLYKHFFQDRFGPGHIINDSVAAKNYLLEELNSFTETSYEMIEPTGWQHNFYRVNLSVVKDKYIPFDLFFNAFLESANNVETVAIDDWKLEWMQIENIINAMELSLPDYEKDKDEIKNRLDEGKYMGHHSQRFNDTY